MKFSSTGWLGRRGLILYCAFAAAGSTFGQSTKDQLKELQRDMATLQDQVKAMQKSQDDRLAELRILLQQALDSSNRANTAVAVLQGSLSQAVGEQVKTMGGTVQGLSGRMDTMSDEFRVVRESINDLNARLSKFDARLTDVQNTVKTVCSPPAAPPPTATGAPAATGGAPAGPPPSAQATYDNAYRDYSGGKLDLAMQEFGEYLKWFKQSDLAPNAQYYVGDIYLRQGDADNAIKAFDAVFEQYPETKITPDAHYMKARALFQSGQKTASAQEYCEVIRLYPSNELANKSRAAIRGMGYTGCGGPAPASSPAATKKKARK